MRIADILIMMDDDPSLRSSRDTRQALIVALVKPGRGACLIGDETLSSTNVFSFSHPAIF
jgi:hypothetical protein